MSTNYRQTLITVSPDCPVTVATPPPKAGSIAGLQYALLMEQPYALTSDELLFEVYAIRSAIGPLDRDGARTAFLSKSQACLRASPLVKMYGWGLHHDEECKVAAIGIETEEYRALTQRTDVRCVAGMRSKRG
ncbi:DUF6157 family protein [Methylorubrum rhodesianum]|uniref:DUF6157 family protein n=1 Tax=Methylorubrum rhodesianum TaxID=29427 RepID=A0ABU9ZG84_9HYPH